MSKQKFCGDTSQLCEKPTNWSASVGENSDNFSTANGDQKVGRGAYQPQSIGALDRDFLTEAAPYCAAETANIEALD